MTTKQYTSDLVRFGREEKDAGDTQHIEKEKCLYLDCEFNGNRGEFISIALVNPHDIDDYFYKVGPWAALAIKPWVVQNVIPFLAEYSYTITNIQTQLAEFINEHDGYIIYADWPEDFIHMLSLLYKIDYPSEVPSKLIRAVKMVMITTPDTFKSEVPHNALEDARALYRNHRLTCDKCKGLGYVIIHNENFSCEICKGSGKKI